MVDGFPWWVVLLTGCGVFLASFMDAIAALNPCSYLGFSMGLLSNGVQKFVGKLGFSYEKVKAGKTSVWLVAHAFVKGIINGYLTDFFQYRRAE